MHLRVPPLDQMLRHSAPMISEFESRCDRYLDRYDGAGKRVSRRAVVEMDPKKWSERTFGESELGDERRTRRLVDYAAREAARPGWSTNAACRGDGAAAEGAYRLLRNDAVNPIDICEGGFTAAVDAIGELKVVLAVEDSTALSFSHGAAESLGDIGGPDDSKARGFIVHSVLLVDPQTQRTLGLVHQSRWTRDAGERGKKHDRKKRAYEDKESYKWQDASECVRVRVGSAMNRLVSVCDREADIYEYLSYKRSRSERFIVRASSDRSLETSNQNLWDEMSSRPSLGTVAVRIEQRGGKQKRKAREVALTIRAGEVTLRPPQRIGAKLDPMTVFVVYAKEEHPPKGTEPLEWMMLTSERVANIAAASTIVRYYGLRWRIEDFHKAWKSGCGVEERRVEAENIERVAVILAFVAVRLLQLREILAANPESSCDNILSPIEWRCLWVIKTKKPIPSVAPTISWANRAIAELGGWRDTKRTGRVGWRSFWRGWLSLQDSVLGWQAAMEAKM